MGNIGLKMIFHNVAVIDFSIKVLNFCLVHFSNSVLFKGSYISFEKIFLSKHLCISFQFPSANLILKSFLLFVPTWKVKSLGFRPTFS